MFGTNPTRPVTRSPDLLAVQEIFFTLQGEGPLSGRRALFIRLAGCNLACHFCDTEFESGMKNLLEVEQIIRSADFACGDERSKRDLVVLTGGEPMRQNISRLVPKLLGTGTSIVQIETAGTLWPDGEAGGVLEHFIRRGEVVLVCSPKTPKVHPKIAELCEDWKYIIAEGETDPDDGLPNRGTQPSNAHRIQQIYRATHGQIWLSPRDDPQKESNTKHARDLCLKHNYRLSLQVHKIVQLP